MWILHAKFIKVHQISYGQYYRPILSIYKIHCFITPTNHKALSGDIAEHCPVVSSMCPMAQESVGEGPLQTNKPSVSETGKAVVNLKQRTSNVDIQVISSSSLLIVKKLCEVFAYPSREQVSQCMLRRI